MKTPSHTKLTKLAVAAIEDLKGQDVKVLDVRALTAITDSMVICTGTSSRHVKSIAENVVTAFKEKGLRPRGIEGLDQGEWVLVDLGGVLVHVMQTQARAFYQLEKLWDLKEAKAAKAAAA
jgi:ribosome-associated protein